MSRDAIVQVKRLRTIGELRDRLSVLGIADQLGVDDAVDPDGPLASGFSFTDGSAGTRTIGNRFTALPMEGWDGDSHGRPTELVHRRWRRFGESGAKLVWGGEAVAVRPDGRANPRQLVVDRSSVGDLAALRADLVDAHVGAHGDDDDLVVGLQLTHSGRWSRPTGSSEPRLAYHHPVLDQRVAMDASHVLSDADLDELIGSYVDAAVLATDAGFDFVDVKHCHGYLLHELLGAVDRGGAYGGSFEHRTTFLRRTVEGIRARAPSLAIGVRLSAYDVVPYEAGVDGVGVPVAEAADVVQYLFDLDGAHRFLDLCRELGVGLVCITAGSPYYNPHVQRPAFFPPSDGYTPPEDPLVGAARMIAACAELAHAHPELAVVGSGYSYLQQWLPNAAQHTIRTGGAASVGIGRGMLSYPALPADVLAGRALDTSRLCRTFSDCTTAPRNGLVSGCFPLDDFYKDRPERVKLAAIKKATRKRTRR
ncbi:MAG TPA: NADH:flavin oxidoreductase [Acidimicrobiia bacterium]|nr:NADH:flavin oxidoreductase [Acidimicrobiia bacterium]